MNYTINLTWDAEVNVWIAESDDIPGLVLESESFDKLVKRVSIAAPEMMELNGIDTAGANLVFVTSRSEAVVA